MIETSDVDIDVFMPTARKRLWNAIYQVHAVLANPYNVRLTIATHEEWPELRSLITDQENERVRWVIGDPDCKSDNPFHEPNGYGAVLKWHRCLERLDWATWYTNATDDDCWLPWAMDHYMKQIREPGADKFGMLITPSLAVSRSSHFDFTPYRLGRAVERCKIGMNNVLINMRKMEALSRPYFDVCSAYADWELIKRLADAFPYKMLDHVTSVQSLCNFENLPPEFQSKVLQRNAR